MKKKILPKIILVAIFLFAFGLLIFSEIKNSQTTDEGVHLFSGYTYLVKNDFRLDPEHPPFLKEVGALPLLFFKDLRMPIDGLWDKAANFYYDSWEESRIMAQNFFYTAGNNPNRLLFWGRFPSIILTLVLGWFSYFWAKKLYGEAAGIFAAFLVLFFPNILAHGTLINTDLGLTLFIFLSVYFWGKFLKNPNRLNFIMTGIILGFAFASKFTSVFLIPILIILIVGKLFFDENAKNWLKYLGGFFGVVICGFIVVWASYGFSTAVPPHTLGSLSENIKLWTSFNIPNTFDEIFHKLRPILFPADFYKGFFLLFRHGLGGHGSFLLGENSSTGWWYYFPVAIFFKTPIPIFIFLGLAIIFFKKIRAKNIFDEFLLIAPPIIFLLIAMFSKADLGIRHILPIFPFLFVFASKSINLVNFKKKFISALIFLVLILWYLYSAVSTYPNYLAYFNEFAGGPKGGYRILTDSNLDWGQDIYRIKKYVEENHILEYYLVYPWDGEDALTYYDLNSMSLPQDPSQIKGKLIVSATYLQTDYFDWLKQYPKKQITPGVFIFDLK